MSMYSSVISRLAPRPAAPKDAAATPAGASSLSALAPPRASSSLAPSASPAFAFSPFTERQSSKLRPLSRLEARWPWPWKGAGRGGAWSLFLGGALRAEGDKMVTRRSSTRLAPPGPALAPALGLPTCGVLLPQGFAGGDGPPWLLLPLPAPAPVTPRPRLGELEPPGLPGDASSLIPQLSLPHGE